MKFYLKNKDLFFTLIIFSIIYYSCQSENYITKEIENSKVILPDSNLKNIDCNNLASIKSQVDLKIQSYINTCYLCFSEKSVPGLGLINWISNSEVYDLDNDMKIQFRTFERNGNLYYSRELLSILNVPKKVGKYVIYDMNRYFQNDQVAWSKYYRLLYDGDVVDASWEIDTSCINFLNITQINLEDRYVEGEFNLHFILNKRNSILVYSDRINFTNSKFQANIDF